MICSVRAYASENETRYGRIHNCKEDGIAQIDKTDKNREDYRFENNLRSYDICGKEKAAVIYFL